MGTSGRRVLTEVGRRTTTGGDPTVGKESGGGERRTIRKEVRALFFTDDVIYVECTILSP